MSRLLIVVMAAAAATSACSPAVAIHTLPEWAPMGGLTIGRHVYLKASQQGAIGIGHELVHVRQQADGPFRFWSTYLLSPQWRMRWEAEAYAVQARAGCPIDGELGLAAYLSGPAYLWPATQTQAGEAIRDFL